MPKKEMTAYQVGVAAEGFAAAIFARAGYHVSVQYGANQPGYDLIVEKGRKAHLVSVKGSQDGAWGLTQSYLRNADYHGAVDAWQRKQGDELVFCFVQFLGKGIGEMPVVFLATPAEVATQLKRSGGGLSDTILHIHKVWKKGKRAGHIDRIPEHWSFSRARVAELFK
jgi:hypothetical protein